MPAKKLMLRMPLPKKDSSRRRGCRRTGRIPLELVRETGKCSSGWTILERGRRRTAAADQGDRRSEEHLRLSADNGASQQETGSLGASAGEQEAGVPRSWRSTGSCFRSIQEDRSELTMARSSHLKATPAGARTSSQSYVGMRRSSGLPLAWIPATGHRAAERDDPRPFLEHRGCSPRGRRECRWGFGGCEDRWDGGAQSGGVEGVGSRLPDLDLTASE